MRISVLIATHERPGQLERCLASVLANQRLPDEVIVADQSRDHETREMVGSFSAQYPGRITYRHCDPPNKSRALNRFLSECSGDFIAFTDDDCLVDPDWLVAFERLHGQHPETDVFYGRMLPEPEAPPTRYVNLITLERAQEVDPVRRPLFPGFSGANCFMRRSICLAVGGFDPDFGPGAPFLNNEDGEMAFRLGRHGARIRFEPTLRIVHAGWRDATDNTRLLEVYAFSLGAFAGRYLRQGDPIPALWVGLRFFAKMRRLLLGVLLFQSQRRADGWLHVAHYAHGFWRGFRGVAGARGA